MLELQEEQLSLLDYKEMSAVYFVKKTNTLHLEVVKKASSDLQNRIKQIEKRIWNQNRGQDCRSI